MTLTQRAVYTDLQAYLGVTLTQLPNADATAFLLLAFDQLKIFFTDRTFNDALTHMILIQKHAEITLGAYYCMDSFANRKYLLAGNTDGSYEGQFSFGGISASSSETNQLKRCEHFDKIKKFLLTEYNRILYLLLDNSDNRITKASKLL